MYTPIYEGIISRCSDSAVRTRFPLKSAERSISSDRDGGGASVTFGFLKNRQLAVSLRRYALYTRNTSDRIRERTFSTSTTPATVELIPSVYVHTMSRRYGTSGARPWEAPAVGRAATRDSACKYRSRVMSVLPFSLPNYFELPLTAWKRLSSIRRNTRITSCTVCRLLISLDRKFLGWRKNSVGRNSIVFSISRSRAARNNFPGATPYASLRCLAQSE